MQGDEDSRRDREEAGAGHARKGMPEAREGGLREGETPGRGRLRLVEEALDERLKELRYLHCLSRLESRPDLDLDALIQEAVEALPGAMRYPEVAGASLAIEEKRYVSPGFVRGPWNMSAAVRAWGEDIGSLEVSYREEVPDADEGPFLAEERALLDTVAERFGHIIEHRRFEEALRASEERYRDLVENAVDLIQSVTPEGRYFYVNPAWREALGYDMEEVANLTLADVIHPEDLAHCLEILKKVMAGERIRGASARFLRKDGSILWVEGNINPFLEGGRVTHTVGIFRDVTSHHAVEEAVRASERWFRSLIENSYDAVTVLDADGNIKYFSPSLERMTGYRPEEIAGKAAFEFIHPEDLPAVAALFSEKIREPYSSATAEYRYRHSDGSWRYLEAVGRNLLSDEAVRGIVVNYHDITERRRMEEALRESEERFRALASAAHDAIVTVNDLGEVTFWNAAAERMFGYAAHEVLGRDLHKLLIPPERKVDYHRDIAAFAVSGTGRMLGKTQELTGRRKDGSTFALELSLSALRIRGRWHAVGIARDISERREAEERLRAANRELEAFAHTLSHDIRGMISTAYGYARMLQRFCGDALDPERRSWLEEIVNSLSRMDRFTTSLLEYARAGVPEGAVTEMPMQEALETALRGLEAAFLRKGVELTVAEGLPSVRADATRLQQVLYNLLHNAVRHAGAAGTPRVEISASVQGEEVVVAVSDNGRGIPAEKLDIIFEPFVRLRGEGTAPGLGIGLSTVKRAVEGWGGRVWAESEPGRGSTFFFTVPAARAGA
ncbi:MAG: PAS domain S-box protein [Actinobacteria bacterium]|nr:PAS domain S-box protein [Actinomycetota bacterium]